MAFLFAALLELAEAAVALAEGATVVAEGAAGAEAVAVEMGVVSESSALLAPLAAAEDAEITYGSISVTGQAARTYQNVTSAYGAASLVGTTAATAGRKFYDSAQKAYENRKRKREENQSSARKRLHFNHDGPHIHRAIKPGRAEGLVGFPNSYTSTVHSFRPVVTT